MIVVVGAGIWGTAIALELRDAGLETHCLDARLPQAASPAAAGLVRPEALERLRQRPEWWGEEHQRRCYAWLECWSSAVEERVTSGDGAEPRRRDGLRRVPLTDLLESVCSRTVRVDQLVPERGGWRLGQLRARQVVLATGCFGDDLLRASGLTPTGVLPLAGTALIGPGQLPAHQVLTRNYRLPGDTRTRQAHLQHWGEGRIRCGDTLGEHALAEQRSVLESFAGEARPWQTIAGLRPQLKQFCVERLAPGLVVATGAGRNGLLSAGGVAWQVRQLLTRPER